MKNSLILILLTLGLFLSCNNKGGGWPAADENKWMNACMGQMGDRANGKEICSCILQKAEKTFPTYQDEETKGTEAQGTQWAQECLNATGNQKGGGGVLNNNNRDNNNGNNNNNNNNNNNGGITGGEREWTDAQKNQFVNECTPAAEKAQGLSNEDAHSYCSCMTEKIALKYSFDEANRLTQADLGTPEWQQAMADCKPHSNY